MSNSSRFSLGENGQPEPKSGSPMYLGSHRLHPCWGGAAQRGAARVLESTGYSPFFLKKKWVKIKKTNLSTGHDELSQVHHLRPDDEFSLNTTFSPIETCGLGFWEIWGNFGKSGEILGNRRNR